MKPSPYQMDHIYSAWQQGIGPIAAACALRLAPMTVIREYVRLDELHALR